ncbi:hypothetical protein Pmani_016131 [Petrolisthes manimaculis]|uniref:Uncharacterized protein n=1 Tax=Petrolisthes manimaculis TaxID=1843537 RepID=A0AAE1PQR2_9EUCA|nr:hypothetical protein Pmani_016131 [Petrolisthes manimaculis]
MYTFNDDVNVASGSVVNEIVMVEYGVSMLDENVMDEGGVSFVTGSVMDGRGSLTPASPCSALIFISFSTLPAPSSQLHPCSTFNLPASVFPLVVFFTSCFPVSSSYLSPSLQSHSPSCLSNFNS